MYKNKLEEDLKKHINLSEGLALAIVKFLMKGKVKKALKKMNDDPEMQAAIDGMNYHAAEVKRLAKKMDKEYGFRL
tara:strand:+ start:363 stop:590 length:228 start_codon:yes stop_codon:yes gene_type:complete